MHGFNIICQREFLELRVIMPSTLMCNEVSVALIFIESSVLLRTWKDNRNHINRRKEPGNVGLLLYNLNLIKESLNIFSLCNLSESGTQDDR